MTSFYDSNESILFTFGTLYWSSMICFGMNENKYIQAYEFETQTFCKHVFCAYEQFFKILRRVFYVCYLGSKT